MGSLSIGDVAREAAISTSAIRYYERAGLLPRAERRSGRRVYDPGVLTRLKLVALAQHAGFRIAEIRTLLNGFSRRTPPSVRWRKLAVRKREELEQTIERAQTMRALLEKLTRCHCPTLEDCAGALERSG